MIVIATMHIAIGEFLLKLVKAVLVTLPLEEGSRLVGRLPSVAPVVVNSPKME